MIHLKAGPVGEPARIARQHRSKTFDHVLARRRVFRASGKVDGIRIAQVIQLIDIRRSIVGVQIVTAVYAPRLDAASKIDTHMGSAFEDEIAIFARYSIQQRQQRAAIQPAFWRNAGER